MTDWYGKGRWTTSDRPMSPGPNQAAYDEGAQQRRFEEQRRLREQRERLDQQQRGQQARADALSAPFGGDEYRATGGAGAANYGGASPDLFHGLVKIAFIALCAILATALWNVTIGTIHSANQMIRDAVEIGGYIAIGAGLIAGFLLRDRILKSLLIGGAIAAVVFTALAAIGLVLITIDP